MTPKQVIKHYGNGDLREAAYRLGYSENALRYWVKKNRVPRHAQKRIAAESGGKLKAMRPNVEFSGTGKRSLHGSAGTQGSTALPPSSGD